MPGVSMTFGPGLGARAGIELRLGADVWLGLGVHAFTTTLDFDHVVVKTGMRGIQFLIT